MNTIISTCGTSTLTNQVPDDLRKLLSSYANCKNSHEVPPQDRNCIEKHINERATSIVACSIREAKKTSAELNGLLSFYDDQPAAHKTDMHWLIATDTWLGQQTANIVKTWLQNNSIANVQIYKPDALQTKSIEDFASSAEFVGKFWFG